MPDTQVMREMPRYQCHKKVWALKIAKVEKVAPTISQLETILNCDPEAVIPFGIIFPEDERYAPFSMPQDYWLKHHPEAGGYYVQYEDGYQSYSPAKAFEEGYTLIP